MPTTLVSFNGTDGAEPFAGLMADAAGDLFGTTSEYGEADGTVFELSGTATPTQLEISGALTLDGGSGNATGPGQVLLTVKIRRSQAPPDPAKIIPCARSESP